MAWVEYFGGRQEPWRRLVNGAAIEVMDEDTGELVDLVPKQSDPTSIEGILIEFAYVDSSDRHTRRVILCWQCWRERGTTYVRGYCAKREALRTFRVDRMSELKEVRSGRHIDHIDAYFRAYAEDRGGGDDDGFERAQARWRPPTQDEIEAEAFRRHLHHRARHACIAGLRVLAYIALADDIRSEEERNVEMSFIESRLAMAGFDHDAGVTEAMIAVGAALAVPIRSFTTAARTVAKDKAYFELVLSCARLMIDFDGQMDAIPFGLHQIERALADDLAGRSVALEANRRALGELRIVKAAPCDGAARHLHPHEPIPGRGMGMKRSLR